MEIESINTEISENLKDFLKLNEFCMKLFNAASRELLTLPKEYFNDEI